MKITAFANFADPQTVPMYRALYECSDHQLILAATEPMEEKFLSLGWPDYNHELPFVRRLYESDDPIREAEELASKSDVLIYGHSPLAYFNLAVKSGRPVFRLSQHIYRDGDLSHVPLKMKLSYYLRHTVKLRHKPVYLMCLGAYTARDFAVTGSYKGKQFEFGEFPEVFPAEWEELKRAKEVQPLHAVWISDLHPWYHPMDCLELAKRTADLPVVFEMFGDGVLEAEVRSRMETEHLTNVTLHLKPSLSKLRESLKRASLYVFTPDANQGWGSSLNLAMNYGCACVVSTAAGASKMILHKQNGLLYESGSVDALEEAVRTLVQKEEMRLELGRHAYESILQTWNGTEAGKRFYQLISALTEGRPDPFDEGLCAPAVIRTPEEMIQRSRQ